MTEWRLQEMDFIEMEEALWLLQNRFTYLNKTEDISIYEAVDRIVAQNYEAQLPSPPFHRSPLDGYALFHGSFPETVSHEKPAHFPVTMKIYAGDYPKIKLEFGCAARIMTGGMIPDGADCVIRQEDTNYGEENVKIYHKAGADENICFAGEDIQSGMCIVTQGQKLSSSVISVLAGQGYHQIKVYQKLSIGVISTGSELIGTDKKQPLEPGKIYDSNSPMVCARLMELGIKSSPQTVEDNVDKISERIKEFVHRCDAVITTGGVSVGQKDYLLQCMESVGAEVLFHGVAMKPGSPMLAAVLDEKPIFALSGNPFAAFACLELLVLPVLLQMSGRTQYSSIKLSGRLGNDFSKKSGGRRFLRGVIGNLGITVPDNHSSGSIASSRGCNCFVDIPAGSGRLEKGSKVNAILFQDAGMVIEKKDYNIPVYAVSGFHKTGKTTILEETIRCLKEAGCSVAVIKHDGHNFSPDVPGTDSDRLKRAGAKAVMIFSDSLRSLVQDVRMPQLPNMIAEMTEQMDKCPDIILLEGFKSCEYPKLVLEEEEADRMTLQEKGRQLAEYLLKEVIH